MKKVLALLLAVALMAAVLAGCAKQEEEPVEEPVKQEEPAVEPEPVVEPEPEPEPEPAEKTTIRLAGLKGPTSIGMVKLLDDAENGLTENAYEFQMAGSADEVTPLLLKGDIDVLAAPVNLASVLYNKSEGKVQLMAVNTLGVIYLVESGETVEDWDALRGKTIYATGKGSIPQYALEYLLASHGIDPAADVTIDWKSEPTEVVSLMKATDDSVVAMLPQPYVTVAQTQVEGLRVVFDLTKEWDALNIGCQLITAGLIVRADFAKDHPEALAKFLEEYRASTEFVNANVEEAAQLVEKYDIVKAAVAQKAIPYCNIVCIAGEEMMESVQGFLEILYTLNPQAVGGSLPDDAFYHLG